MNPTALGDQIDAATRDTWAAAARMATAGRYTLQWCRPGPFVRELAADLDERARTGRLQMCEHAKSPTTVIFAAWDRRAVCAGCAQTRAKAIRGTREDKTCDRCRRVGPSLLTTTTVPLGPVLLLFGLCRRCMRAEGRVAA